MTSRQRFREVMGYGDPDRAPCFEEGLRDGVLEQWHRQGLPKDADLAGMFHMDRRERISVKLEPIPDTSGRPRTARGLESLRRRLNPDEPGRLPDDWPARAKAWRRRDYVLELPIHRGFFLSMGVGGWRRFADVMYLLHDAPKLLREIMSLHGELAARLAERVLREAAVDFVSFSEPIGGNDGPLLSPRQYEEFVLSSYKPVLDVARRHRVATICFVTYGNARALIPGILKAGFNCLWAIEANMEAMDYRGLRREFGRDLRLIGGIDLDTLLIGKQAIRREIMTKAPALLAEGGYIPLADGRVRENVPFENYVYYRRLLERVAEGANRDS